MFSASLIGALATLALVQAQAFPGTWGFADFQGTTFHLVDGQANDATPVQGFSNNVPTLNSQWMLVNQSAPNTYQIINLNPAGTFLGYSTLTTGGQAIRSQLAGNRQAANWIFTPPSGQLIEVSSGLAVTSYATGLSGSHPFTLEPADANDPHQFFELIPA
uniref:Ricin B lectin domain-containing protein n=1 Tax=Mycena chlorophos TaxID=658473 RepID=A0ABQ0M6H3_MYCCL|nr:predicted protein [Mycena chlorophos]